MISFSSEQRFIVTGASSGIGEDVALLLNKLGATVICIGRNAERLKVLQTKAKNPDNVFCEVKDLTEDIGDLPSYVKFLREKYGKFQGMAFCAGIGGILPLRAVSLDEIHKVFNINYFAPIFMAKGFADRRNHVEKGVSMVFVASAGGIHCDPGMTAYAGSKGALISSVQSISRELAPSGVRVNCVSPTLIETDMADDIARDYAKGKYPFGLGHVSDVSNMIVFLLSEKSRWITTQNYIIDCGAI